MSESGGSSRAVDEANFCCWYGCGGCLWSEGQRVRFSRQSRLLKPVERPSRRMFVAGMVGIAAFERAFDGWVG